MIVVAKIGTSSVTRDDGTVDDEAVAKLCREVKAVRDGGDEVVVVTSGAVTAGVASLKPEGGRPGDLITLQALSAIGQHRLMRVYDDAFASHGLSCGQVLLTPANFGERRQYLHARATIMRLLALGVVPVINENDAIADDEFRFSDNDRLAALVANLVSANVLVLLTDTAGLYESDPRFEVDATLIEEVREVDEAILKVASGPIREGARGGMTSKLVAARMASRSGVRSVIAAAHRPRVLIDSVAGVPGVGTQFPPRAVRLSARRLWIAFALPTSAIVVVDEGAHRALVDNDASLLPAGLVEVRGEFTEGDAVEVATRSGEVFAKGIARLSADQASSWQSQRTRGSSPRSRELIHRDDLVILEERATP